ncbi:Beta-klotho [Rhynchospora pubera]|uniref:Beta-klotho n=1 Tax=Rhynchospora pubera TaxID=906938 RepID=A0AAV8GTC4_9POAL|nr:Beta-klotho [Rhynchospora pubera]
MAMSAALKIALAVSVLGCLSFIFGCIAENKKPDNGIPNTKGDIVVCHYPNDPSIALGALSIIFLVASCVAGQVAVFFPYKAKSVPKNVLFSNISLVVFYIVAQGVTALALGLTLWATVTEGLHRHRNTHHNLETDCPTAKTGLFGGAAFLSLDACLFWLVCQMLTLNAHSDYLDRDEDSKGEYGEVLASDFYTSGTRSKV